jgi:hypothetical protein
VLESRIRLDSAERGQADAVDLMAADLKTAGFRRVFSNRRDIWLAAGLRNADGTAMPDGHDPKADAYNCIALSTPGQDALFAGIEVPARNDLTLSFREGILRASPGSKFLQAHPETLLTGDTRGGAPLRRPVLDPSHPLVQEKIFNGSACGRPA